MTEPEAGLAQALVDRGHFVLQAYDDRPIPRGEVRVLTRPSREGIASALIAAGIAESRAHGLARDSARNLAVLRRLIPNSPGRLPGWAQETPPHSLLAALLAGGWDENVKADQAILAEIAGHPYGTLITELAPYVGNFDSPIQKIGSTWRIASPSDAWILLASYLTSDDSARFGTAAFTVLGSPDPFFGMKPDDRWTASMKGIHREYSGMLRHGNGIGQVLILLALWGDMVRIVPNAGRCADAIVDKLLRNADQQRWWSLSGDFRLLAEASPKAFLSALEDSLDQTDPPIRALFGKDEGGIFETEHLSGLLWALESLAWSPELMPRVTHVLSRLDAIDTSTRRNANSLRQIHRLWIPQTYATLDQRLRAIDLIRKKENDAAWNLMLAILPHGYDTSTPSPMPRWRDFTVDRVEIVTFGLIARGALEITKRLIEDADLNASRWSMLLDRLQDLAPDPESGLAALEKAARKITDKEDRSLLWAKLRNVLHNHRRNPDAKWTLPTGVLDRLEVLYDDRFSILDPLENTAWLFGYSVALPHPPTAGWEAEQRDIDMAMKKAAKSVFSEGRATSIQGLAHQVEVPAHIGKALYDSGLSESDLDSLLEVTLRSGNLHERDVAKSLITSAFFSRKEPWAAALITKAENGAWGDEALLAILLALPVQRWTWDQAAQTGGGIEDAYWRQVPVFWMCENMSENSEDISFAIRKLISVGRARPALSLAGHKSKVHLSSDLLIEVLREAARQPFESKGNPNEATMFQYYVTGIFQILDGRNDVGKDILVALEWTYLPVLEYSSRPAYFLLRALSDQPAIFIDMIKAAFKASEESGFVDEEPENTEQAGILANQAYRLLERWNRLPGTRDDGTIDEEVLEAWIKEARSLAKSVGREEVADNRIGKMLSASPVGTDGKWPAEAVRDVLDLFRSKPMIEGFWVGKRNRRGVTRRLPRDGGNLERQEAEKYRKWAREISYDHPHTAKALDLLADSYEDEARSHDEDAERLDWEEKRETGLYGR